MHLTYAPPTYLYMLCLKYHLLIFVDENKKDRPICFDMGSV